MSALKSAQSIDPLFAIFETHLHSGLYDDQPVDIFVRDVVDYYWKTLLASGNIPKSMHETLRVDLLQDVREMLRARIYGHYNIAAYRKSAR